MRPIWSPSPPWGQRGHPSQGWLWAFALHAQRRLLCSNHSCHTPAASWSSPCLCDRCHFSQGMTIFLASFCDALQVFLPLFLMWVLTDCISERCNRAVDREGRPQCQASGESPVAGERVLHSCYRVGLPAFHRILQKVL